jgi:hypothetical protein
MIRESTAPLSPLIDDTDKGRIKTSVSFAEPMVDSILKLTNSDDDHLFMSGGEEEPNNKDASVTGIFAPSSELGDTKESSIKSMDCAVANISEESDASNSDRAVSAVGAKVLSSEVEAPSHYIGAVSVGDKVTVNFKGRGQWHPADVIKVFCVKKSAGDNGKEAAASSTSLDRRFDCFCDVLYEDGDNDYSIPINIVNFDEVRYVAIKFSSRCSSLVGSVTHLVCWIIFDIMSLFVEIGRREGDVEDRTIRIALE